MPNLKEILEFADESRRAASVGFDYWRGVADALEWATGNREEAPGEAGWDHDLIKLDERIQMAFDRERSLFRRGLQFSISNPRDYDSEGDDKTQAESDSEPGVFHARQRVAIYNPRPYYDPTLNLELEKNSPKCYSFGMIVRPCKKPGSYWVSRNGVCGPSAYRGADMIPFENTPLHVLDHHFPRIRVVEIFEPRVPPDGDA